MSDAAHEHAHGGPDHVPHITPLSTYLKTYGALVALTVITVSVSYVNLGSSVNLAIALVIALIKATTVAALFMHLLHDSKFHSVIILSSLVFLTVFIAFTMFDTAYRGQVNAEDGQRTNMDSPFAAASNLTPVPTAAPVAAPAAPHSSASPGGSATPTGSAVPAGSGAPVDSASPAPSASPSGSSGSGAPGTPASSGTPRGTPHDGAPGGGAVPTSAPHPG